MSSGLPKVSITAPDQSSFYQPLPTTTSFRLLHFSQVNNAAKGNASSSEVDNHASRLQCHLEVHDIEHSPHYQALSYTWGQPYYTEAMYRAENDEAYMLPEFTSFDYSITCDGRPFRLTKNLFNALSTLVPHLNIQYLWVDAVCINQADVDQERPQQVGVMGSIFRSAEEVLFWVGHNTEQAEDLLWIATSFVGAVERLIEEWGEEHVLSGGLPSGVMLLHPSTDSSVSRLRSAMDLYGKSRIFSRAWTVQEFANARQPRIFCGEVEIPWENLLRLAIWFDPGRSFWNRAAADMPLTPPRTIFMRRGFCGNLKTWSSFRDQMKYCYGMPLGYQGALSKREHSYALLLEAVSQIQRLRASDPRDKVFAALSLGRRQAHDATVTSTITPTYTASYEQVYVDFAATMLEELPTMSILSFLDAKRARLDTNWPSWVSNWVSYPAPTSISIICTCFEEDRIWNVWKDVKISGELNIDRTQMQLSMPGIQVSIIDAVEDLSVNATYDRRLVRILELFKLCQSLPRIYEFTESNKQSRVEALWRTMLMDYPPSTDPEPSHFWTNLFAAYVAWQVSDSMFECQNEVVRGEARKDFGDFCCEFEEECTNGEVPSFEDIEYLEERIMYYRASGRVQPDVNTEVRNVMERMERFHILFARFCGNRLIFRTRDGILGAGYPFIEAGDEVWLLKGMETPALLRRGENPKEYKIIGECYLHGCMNGELFRSGHIDVQSAGPITII